jgi:hypothetical protein
MASTRIHAGGRTAQSIKPQTPPHAPRSADVLFAEAGKAMSETGWLAPGWRSELDRRRSSAEAEAHVGSVAGVSPMRTDQTGALIVAAVTASSPNP